MNLLASLVMFLFGAAAVFVIFSTTDVVKFFRRRRARRLDPSTNATFVPCRPTLYDQHEYAECAYPHSSEYYKGPHCQHCGAPGALPSTSVNEMPKPGGKFNEMNRVVTATEGVQTGGYRAQELSDGGISPLVAGWIGYEIGRNSGAPSAEAPEGATDPRDYAADPPAPAPDADQAPEPAEAPAPVEQSEPESSTSSFDSEPTSSFDSEPSASE